MTAKSILQLRAFENTAGSPRWQFSIAMNVALYQNGLFDKLPRQSYGTKWHECRCIQPVHQNRELPGLYSSRFMGYCHWSPGFSLLLY